MPREQRVSKKAKGSFVARDLKKGLIKGREGHKSQENEEPGYAREETPSEESL